MDSRLFPANLTLPWLIAIVQGSLLGIFSLRADFTEMIADGIGGAGQRDSSATGSQS